MTQLTDEQIGILKDAIANLVCGDTKWCFNHDSRRPDDYSECHKCLDLILTLNSMNDSIGKGGRTGKCDIDGTEIYDGDILKYPNHAEPYHIMWSDDSSGFVCENTTNFMLSCIWHEMKIVENMRNNPELMGYKK